MPRRVLQELSAFLKKKDDEINQWILTEKITQNILFESEIVVKDFLEQLFGKEQAISDLGLIGDLFTYNDFSDGIIFSYWSFKGDRDNYDEEFGGRWRENFFFKGKRWSNPDSRNNFYSIFRNITKATKMEGFSPLNLFIGQCNNNTLDYLVIRFHSKPEIKTNRQTRTLMLPNREAFRAISTNYYNLIEKYRGYTNYSRDAFLSERTVNDDEIFNSFSAIFEELWENNTWIESWKNKINDFFPKNEFSTEQVFYLILTLQFFDQDYVIDVLLPKSSQPNSTTSALTLTTKNGIDTAKRRYL